jgi:hypothetical protein
MLLAPVPGNDAGAGDVHVLVTKTMGISDLNTS